MVDLVVWWPFVYIWSLRLAWAASRIQCAYSRICGHFRGFCCVLMLGWWWVCMRWYGKCVWRGLCWVCPCELLHLLVILMFRILRYFCVLGLCLWNFCMRTNVCEGQLWLWEFSPLKVLVGGVWVEINSYWEFVGCCKGNFVFGAGCARCDVCLCGYCRVCLWCFVGPIVFVCNLGGWDGYECKLWM